MISQDEQDSNLLLVPGIMNAPRTPGAESGQVSCGAMLKAILFLTSLDLFHFRKEEIESVQLCRRKKMPMKKLSRRRR